jgi:hypothetical protein
MIRKRVVHALVVASLAFGGTAVFAPSAAAVEMSVRVAGVACPRGVPGTVGLTAVGGTTIELVHSSFLAEFGPGIPEGRSRSACSVTLQITGPPGVEFAVLQVYRYGRVRLPRGATAVDESHQTFSSGQFTPRTSLSLTGPVDTDWSRVHAVPVSARAWSGCDGSSFTLTLNGLVDVYRASGNVSVVTSGFMSVEREKVILTFRNC